MIPFMKLFYGSPSVHLWEDEMGDAHEIVQEEGGEQGDLLTLPFNLVHHSALMAVNAHLLERESLFAFHDDLYVLCLPGRVQNKHIDDNLSSQ